MAPLVSIFVLVTMFYFQLHVSKRNDKFVTAYRPNKPRTCRQHCGDLDESFSFMKEYRCRLTSVNVSSSKDIHPNEDALLCFVKQKAVNGTFVWRVIIGRDTCDTDSRVTEVPTTGKQESPKYKINISLVQASRKGQLCLVKYILKHQLEDVNSTGEAGYTPALMAVYFGHKDVLDLLVSKGCNLQAMTKQMLNILHVACSGGHVDMVKYIITKNVVSIDSRCIGRITPIMLAAQCGHTKVVRLLVSKGCNLKTLTVEGYNILHTACIGGNVKLVKYILSLGIVDIDSKTRSGKTPVMMAAAKGYKRVFDLLLNKGCDLKTKTVPRTNILHEAVKGGNVKMVKYIISLGIVDIDSKTRFGTTPVMTAAGRGNREVFDLLVKNGCSLTARDTTIILYIACRAGKVDIVKYILSRKTTNLERKGSETKVPRHC